MKTTRLPFHLVRWTRSLDRRPNLKKFPLFTYDLGPLGRIVHPAIPPYRYPGRATRVTRGPRNE